VNHPDSRVLLEPVDGSVGPLLRLADDRLTPGQGYGRHTHRDVDVVVVVLSGSLTHRWERGAVLGPGDVGVLRAGAGLAHDEVAGDDGAHVVQAYLRSSDPGASPEHQVLAASSGWVDLRRVDARLWLAVSGVGELVAPPPGLWVVHRDGEVTAGPGEGVLTGPLTVCAWQVDTARPTWAE
jgi:redox-sensitive bicupin YhaK (pirin superfamily)